MSAWAGTVTLSAAEDNVDEMMNKKPDSYFEGSEMQQEDGQVSAWTAHFKHSWVMKDALGQMFFYPSSTAILNCT